MLGKKNGETYLISISPQKQKLKTGQSPQGINRITQPSGKRCTAVFIENTESRGVDPPRKTCACFLSKVSVAADILSK
ncbi:MAG: hypothetical protein DRJ01_05855 [Bacteroidetes bacterium]|nr:MAG: hypothetical protein DRJ01_05855 [Bacteroidota bacterium]